MSKKTESVAITRANIVDAFWSLYKTRSIENISVRLVMEKAGYNRCTFYEYFNNVYEILEECENKILENLQDAVESCAVMALAYMDSKEIIRLFVDIYEENGEYLTLILGENGDPKFQQRFKDTIKPMFAPVFLKQPDIKKEYYSYVSEYYTSALLNVLTKWYRNGKDIPPEELIKILYYMSVGSKGW